MLPGRAGPAGGRSEFGVITLQRRNIVADTPGRNPSATIDLQRTPTPGRLSPERGGLPPYLRPSDRTWGQSDDHTSGRHQPVGGFPGGIAGSASPCLHFAVCIGAEARHQTPVSAACPDSPPAAVHPQPAVVARIMAFRESPLDQSGAPGRHLPPETSLVQFPPSHLTPPQSQLTLHSLQRSHSNIVPLRWP